MPITLGIVAFTGGTLLVGGTGYWLYKRKQRIPPGQLRAPPKQVGPLQVSVPPGYTVQSTASTQPTVSFPPDPPTSQIAPSSALSLPSPTNIQSAGVTGAVLPAGQAQVTGVSTGTDWKPTGFVMDVKPVPPDYLPGDMTQTNQLVAWLKTVEERKRAHPTDLDKWVDAHLSALDEAAHIRAVLAGTE